MPKPKHATGTFPAMRPPNPADIPSGNLPADSQISEASLISITSISWDSTFGSPPIMKSLAVKN